MSYLLYVDDDDDLRLLIGRLLGAAGHEVGLAAGGAQALAAIEAREPELVILDLSMPDMSGFELCQFIKSNPFTSNIPVLMLTAMGDIDHKIEGFEAGTDDYMAKPFEPRELTARVAALLRLVRREGDRNPTSGLPGGQAIHAEIARRVAEATPFAICYLDLDFFKPFADRFGFTVADLVIRGAGMVVRNAVAQFGRPGDFAGHIGGDDFIAVTDPATAQPIARAAGAGFPGVLNGLVDEAIVARRCYPGLDRDGARCEFPLTQFCVAVLIVDPQKWVSTAHLGAFAADLKRRAKRQGPGTILVQNV